LCQRHVLLAQDRLEADIKYKQNLCDHMHSQLLKDASDVKSVERTAAALILKASHASRSVQVSSCRRAMKIHRTCSRTASLSLQNKL
jgi:hypothetical protein